MELSTTTSSIHQTQGRMPLGKQQPVMAPTAEQVAKAEEVQQAFSDFFGKTFYGQLMKSMRQTVGEPAYFHGGRAEEVFRGQLDQTIADHLSESQGAGLSNAAFQQQFPQHADVLRRDEEAEAVQNQTLDQLSSLRRR